VLLPLAGVSVLVFLPALIPLVLVGTGVVGKQVLSG
jgi:hypothetical protein